MSPRPQVANTAKAGTSSTTRPSNRRFKRVHQALFALVLLGTLTAVGVSTEEALAERRVAVAAADLQVAARTVETADIVAGYGGDIRLSDLAASVEILDKDHELALHSLPGKDAENARRLLVEIADHGSSLLVGERAASITHDHHELIDLLGLASSNARHHAGLAERWAALAVLAAVVVSSIGGWRLIRTRIRNEQHRSRAEAEAHAGRRLQSLLNDSPEIFLVIDNDGQITYRSASADRLLPKDPCTCEDLVALADTSVQEMLRSHLGDSHAGDVSDVFNLTDADDQRGWFELRVSDLSDDDLVEGHVVTARDVTNEVVLRKELQRLANTDLLTGLPNRRVLQTTIDDAASVLHDGDRMMALMIFDIDGFKAVNDTLGHIVGDELLTRVAGRLFRALDPADALLRLGGDEFALVVHGVASAPATLAKAEALLEALDEPFQLGNRAERVRTSVGVAVTSDPDHADALLSEADIAMYEAKRQGGDTAVLYESALDATSTRVTRMTRALREADYDSEFSVVYQPIVTIDDDKIVGLEALLRWTSPELGSVTPGEFIPVAEACGEICAIGEWVLTSVCAQMAEWIELGIDSSISVSFNVSPRQLAQAHFVSGVLAIARRWSIPPERLVVEITESTALDHAGTAIARLEQLREKGFQVSVDDFGSGYSNLGQLLRVPFDVIKIDRSLLLTLSEMRERAGGDPTSPCAIMEAIVSIAAVLGAPVICEGVETEVQRASLQASGLTYVQGYLTGRPLPPATITPRLRTTAFASMTSS